MALITLLLAGLLVFSVMGQDFSEPCYGGDSCCDSRPGGCPEGEGDCDMDSHCAGELVCGEDNCNGSGFDSTDDCCEKPTKNPIEPADGSDIPITLSCNQMKKAHIEIIRAQVAYGCSSCSETGEPAKCDREVLKKFLNCSNDESLCLVNSIASTASCNVTEDKPDTICKALHQLHSYVLYTRQVFCAITGFRGGCNWWTALSCTIRLVPIAMQCATGGPLGIIPCVERFIDSGSSCFPCIQEVLEDLIDNIGK